MSRSISEENFMKFRQGRFVFSVSFFIALAVAFPIWRQHAQDVKSKDSKIGANLQRYQIVNPDTPDENPVDAYGVFRSADGAACRQMTALEFKQMRVDQPQVEVREISDGGARRTLQDGLKITLRGTQQLEQFPDAKQAFLRAAAKWQA